MPQLQLRYLHESEPWKVCCPSVSMQPETGFREKLACITVAHIYLNILSIGWRLTLMSTGWLFRFHAIGML